MSDLTVNSQLGRLEQVNVRDYWKNEAYDFTPWLAQPENLELLGDTIGIELEYIATEKAVGPFSADILCKNTATDEWVLIENQLEKTDHSHLGQIITYAAGLQATAIIWIAQRFTEEHRAALDWLNEHTNEKMRFWGVTVELWRIGNSALAPKFNVVARPNDWSKAIEASKENTSNQELRYRYWSLFRDVVEVEPEHLKIPNPKSSYYVNFATGRTGVLLYASFNMSKHWLRTEIYLSGLFAKNRFHQFLLHKEEIEQITGKLDWQNIIVKQDARISLTLPNTDIANEADWQRQHEWLRETAKKFHAAFAPLIRQLQDNVNFIPAAQEDEVGAMLSDAEEEPVDEDNTLYQSSVSVS